MSNTLPIIAGLLSLVSPVVYIRSILKGKSRPHRTTRFVLSFITSLTFFSLLATGNSSAIWLAGASMLESLAIFIVSIKYGMGGKTKFDVGCLCLALAGVVLWQVTNNPLVGLYASIIADFVGYIPAYVKTFKHPDTEEWHFYGLGMLAGALVLIALPDFSFNVVIYPLYIFVANLVMVVLSSRKEHGY